MRLNVLKMKTVRRKRSCPCCCHVEGGSCPPTVPPGPDDAGRPWDHWDHTAEQCFRTPINQQAQLKPFSRGSLIRKIWFQWVILLEGGSRG